MSSWLDRLSIGVMVYNMLKLPGIFVKFHFLIEYNENWPVQAGKTGKYGYGCLSGVLIIF